MQPSILRNQDRKRKTNATMLNLSWLTLWTYTSLFPHLYRLYNSFACLHLHNSVRYTLSLCFTPTVSSRFVHKKVGKLITHVVIGSITTVASRRPSSGMQQALAHAFSRRRRRLQQHQGDIENAKHPKQPTNRSWGRSESTSCLDHKIIEFCWS